jgi:hypothetical protein
VAGPGKASMVRDRRFVFLPDTCRAALRSHKNLPVLVHPFGLPVPTVAIQARLLVNMPIPALFPALGIWLAAVGVVPARCRRVYYVSFVYGAFSHPGW